MINKLLLPLIFALLGFLFTTRRWILFMDSLNPFYGLITYYTIITITVLLLEYYGLVISDIKYDSFYQTIGTLMIIFSFFILVNWASCYINTVTKGKCDKKDMSNVYLQSEDGATYYLWSRLTDNANLCRILTYCVTPFALTFIGQNMIIGKIML